MINDNHLPAALAYGKAGFKIFPILEMTKDQPLIKQWGVCASSDAAQITTWWTRWPQANIGLACMPSVIGVIDSDAPKGEETLQELEQIEGKALSPTKMARSPRGGTHRFYLGRVATTVGKIGKNVDTRGIGSGNGGYVLLAPSRTKDGAYSWIDKAPMAPIDPWVVEACGERAPDNHGPASQEPVVEWDQDINVAWARDWLMTLAPKCQQGAGGGETFVKRVVPHLKDHGISEEMAAEIIGEAGGYNETKCEPPWQYGDCDDKDNLFVKIHNSYLYCRDRPPGVDTAEADFGADEEEIDVAAPVKSFFDSVLDEYVLCLDPVAFIRRSDKTAFGPGQFDARHNPAVNRIEKLASRYKDHAAKYAMARDVIERAEGMCYRPGNKDNVVDGRFNMWTDPGVSPLDGKPAIFIEHLRYLIPNERERIIFANWLAHLVQHPEEKIMWAVLIVGLEGTGKSWLGYMLRKMLGDANVVMVENDDPIGDTFNGWTENRRLGFIHELAPDPKIDLVARVKGTITEAHVWVNEKYIKRHRVENMCHLLAVTNHETSVKMLRSNRRWFVIRAADDPVGIGPNGEPTPECNAYYKKLFDAIGPVTDPTPTDEVRRILGWLSKRDVSKFDISIAPESETKHEIADAGTNLIAGQVAQLYRSQSEPFQKDRTLVTPGEVVACIDVGKAYRDNLQGALALVSAAMIDLGCRKVTDLVRVGKGDRTRLWSTTRAFGIKYRAMDDLAVAAIYKRECAAAEKRAAKGRAEQTAADFGAGA